jgi:hypothetical protein
MLTPPDPTRRPKDICDGFTHSSSLLYLSSRYRAHALAQLEVLRRARSYRHLVRCVPDNLLEPIPAFSQIEQQVHVEPGTYLIGLLLSAGVGNGIYSGSENMVHFNIVDSCTKTPLASEYTFGNTLTPAFRNPHLLSAPRLIDEPGLLNCECYVRAPTPLFVQLCLFFATPSLLPWEAAAYYGQGGNRT